ncbi:hypothetical protein FB107DRAFT_280997 [Schizophyllum commune]
MDQAATARGRAARYQLKWEPVRTQGEKALAHDFGSIRPAPDMDVIRELEALEEAEAIDEVDDEEMDNEEMAYEGAEPLRASRTSLLMV